MLFFCLFQCFEETEYQTESKRNKTFGNVIFTLNVIEETGREVEGEKKEGEGGGGGAPPSSWPLVNWLDVGSKSPELYSVRKSRSRRFYSVWTPFDIPFIRNTKIGKNSNSGLGLRLID